MLQRWRLTCLRCKAATVTRTPTLRLDSSLVACTASPRKRDIGWLLLNLVVVAENHCSPAVALCATETPLCATGFPLHHVLNRLLHLRPLESVAIRPFSLALFHTIFVREFSSERLHPETRAFWKSVWCFFSATDKLPPDQPWVQIPGQLIFATQPKARLYVICCSKYVGDLVCAHIKFIVMVRGA